jgi:hypothetical protein
MEDITKVVSVVVEDIKNVEEGVVDITEMVAVVVEYITEVVPVVV